MIKYICRWRMIRCWKLYYLFREITRNCWFVSNFFLENLPFNLRIKQLNPNSFLPPPVKRFVGSEPTDNYNIKKDSIQSNEASFSLFLFTF